MTSSPAGASTGGSDSVANTVYGPEGPVFDATPPGVREALDATGLSVTGAGITVGVLSDSFNDLGGAAADESAGRLGDMVFIQDLPSSAPSFLETDEGRAMLQVVHDIAPGADEAFYSASLGYDTAQDQQDFANGILALANAGCKVICDDVTFWDEPWFQSGVVAQAIQTVEQEGVVYVTCAANFASSAYQSAWTHTSVTLAGANYNDALNFGTSTNPTPFQYITLSPGAGTDGGSLELQWDQPWGAATSNLEVIVATL